MSLPFGRYPLLPRVSAALAAILLLSAAGCGAIRGRPFPIDRSGDPGIVAALQARLQAEPSLDAAEFRVESNGGVLLLYGTVHGMGEWSCALRNAHLVEGVRTVVDYLVIERGPRDVDCMAVRGQD